MSIQIKTLPRKGVQDTWNAFMVDSASFTANDIPILIGSSKIPVGLIPYDEAKTIYNKRIKNEPDFKDNRFVHFYIDDQKFDGKKNSIWTFPKEALRILKHFAGIITPDFSTYCDFPYPIKLINTFRMRSFGFWISKQGIEVINNVRWGTPETYHYCFDGIPEGSVVAIGTVASGLRSKENRKLFDDGFKKMMDILQPKAIIIYGSSNFAVIQEAKSKGVSIIAFESKTSLSFKQKEGCLHE